MNKTTLFLIPAAIIAACTPTPTPEIIPTPTPIVQQKPTEAKGSIEEAISKILENTQTIGEIVVIQKALLSLEQLNLESSELYTNKPVEIKYQLNDNLEGSISKYYVEVLHNNTVIASRQYNPDGRQKTIEDTIQIGGYLMPPGKNELEIRITYDDQTVEKKVSGIWVAEPTPTNTPTPTPTNTPTPSPTPSPTPTYTPVPTPTYTPTPSPTPSPTPTYTPTPSPTPSPTPTYTPTPTPTPPPTPSPTPSPTPTQIYIPPPPPTITPTPTYTPTPSPTPTDTPTPTPIIPQPPKQNPGNPPLA